MSAGPAPLLDKVRQNLLLDTRGLTGFDPPEIFERYRLAERLASEGKSAVKVVVLAQPEMIHPEKFGMIVAAGLAWNHWIGFLISLVLFGIGTAIRVRSEEKLLREQFGAAFEDYKRNVPAVVPIKL